MYRNPKGNRQLAPNGQPRTVANNNNQNSSQTMTSTGTTTTTTAPNQALSQSLLKPYGVLESCNKIKDEFESLQSQYSIMRHELDKMSAEKSEMQRHYIMYYEMSYGLNISLCKENEICKRLSSIILQLLPYLDREHQQQVAVALDRAKQVTPNELNSIISCQFSPGANASLNNLQMTNVASTPYPSAHLTNSVSHSPGMGSSSVTAAAASLLAQNLSPSPFSFLSMPLSSTVTHNSHAQSTSVLMGSSGSGTTNSSSVPISAAGPQPLPPPTATTMFGQSSNTLGHSLNKFGNQFGAVNHSSSDMANFLAMAGLMPGALQALGASPHPLASLANSLVSGSMSSAGSNSVSLGSASLESVLSGSRMPIDSRRLYMFDQVASLSSRNSLNESIPMPQHKAEIQSNMSNSIVCTTPPPPTLPPAQAASALKNLSVNSQSTESNMSANIASGGSSKRNANNSTNNNSFTVANTNEAPRTQGSDSHRSSKSNRSHSQSHNSSAEGSVTKRPKTVRLNHQQSTSSIVANDRNSGNADQPSTGETDARAKSNTTPVSDNSEKVFEPISQQQIPASLMSASTTDDSVLESSYSKALESNNALASSVTPTTHTNSTQKSNNSLITTIKSNDLSVKPAEQIKRSELKLSIIPAAVNSDAKYLSNANTTNNSSFPTATTSQ